MEMRALNLESYECTVPSSGLNVEEVKKKKNDLDSDSQGLISY